jgi:VIT1/CCC1 family predicted Fe2+/Mn2+ transporter
MIDFLKQLSWGLLQHTAEQIELWTSLAINLWLLGSALIFVLTRLQRVIVPLDEQIKQALRYGLPCAISLLLSALYIAMIYSAPWASDFLRLGGTINGVMLPALMFFVLGHRWHLQWKRRSN